MVEATPKAMKTPKSASNSPTKTPKGGKDKKPSSKGKAQNTPKGKEQEASETQPEDSPVAEETPKEKTQNSPVKENPEEVPKTENLSGDEKNDDQPKAPQSNGTSITISKDVLDETSTRCQDRDRRTLFLRFPKNSPIKKTADILKIVTTAIDVRFPRHTNRGKPTVCYVEFKTEKEAEQQKTKLEGTEIGNEKLYIDYVGCKSKHFTKREERPINPLQLFIGGLVTGTSTEDLETAFPSASLWEIPKDKKKVPKNFGFVTFSNAEDAQEAFKKCKEIEIKGRKVTVLYALAKDPRKRKAKPGEAAAATPAKKAKVEKSDDEEASEEKMEVEKGEAAEEDTTSAPKKKKKKNRRRKNKKASAETKEEGEKEEQAADEKEEAAEVKMEKEEEGDDQDMGDDDDDEDDEDGAGVEDGDEADDVEDGDDADVEDGDDAEDVEDGDEDEEGDEDE